MPRIDEPYDVTIIGGGPGGTAAAICCAREGLSVRLVEKERFPRFHIGESLIPHSFEFLAQLGLADRVEQLRHVPKYGAAFVMGDANEPTRFWFPDETAGTSSRSLNIDRSCLDKVLLDAARGEGVDVLEGVRVRAIKHLELDRVVLDTSEGELKSRLLLDASGQGSVVGRHFGTRRSMPDTERVAYFEHFEGVEHPEGRARGSSIIVMCDEGWFWLIPLDESRTSVGLVLRTSDARASGVRADELLGWGIERSPFVRNAMRNAQGPAKNRVCADYSYSCRPYAGDGYFLVGDAAVFVDPVFSTGVSMAFASGQLAANAAVRVLRDPRSAPRTALAYSRSIDRSSAPLFRFIEQFYHHPFRELLLAGEGPLGVHDAVLSVLSGRVFPRMRFSVRWRIVLFRLLLRMHAATGRLVPRIEPFSLMTSDPIEPESTPERVPAM